MKQVAGNLTMAGLSLLEGRSFVILDRDMEYTASFPSILKSAGLEVIRLPPYSPDFDTAAERWMLSVKKASLPTREYSAKEGYGEPCPSTSSIITKSVTTKGSTTSFPLRGAITPTIMAKSSAKRGSAGCSSSITGSWREGAPMRSTGVVLGRCSYSWRKAPSEQADQTGAEHQR